VAPAGRLPAGARRRQPDPDLAEAKVDVQERVIAIWEKIFKVPVRPDTDFFVDVDGDSGAAAAIAYWIGEELGVEVPIAEVLERATPAELAEYVAELVGTSVPG
jgi:acyl carrier protein